MKVSLVLLLKNGEKYLPKLFNSLEEQQFDGEKEIIIVYSGSKNPHPVPPCEISWDKEELSIKQEDFSHGGTRNLAVTRAKGEIVVFLSQDALPVDKYWLKNLLKNFSDPQVAGVFGRQIPYEQTNSLEKYFYEKSYPGKSRRLTQKSDQNFSNQNLFFSNVNGAARKSLLTKYPFRSDLVMSEDQYWAREVINSGYEIVYEPDAAVFHSHNYTLWSLFRRYYWSGYSQKQLNLRGKQLEKGLETGWGLVKYLFSNDFLMLPYAVLYLTVKGLAFYLGKNFSR